MKKVLLILVCCSCGVKTVETNSTVGTELADTLATGFDENNYESSLDLKNYLVDDEPDRSQILVVDSSGVVVILPNDEQVKEMEEKYGDDFYTIADDALFYHSEASMRIDSAGVKRVTMPSEQRYVRLKGTSKSWLLDLRKEGAPEWNMVFFHAAKEPEIVSAIDVTTDRIHEFFGK